MKELTLEQIKKINDSFDWGHDQGIFIEPFGCDGVKEHVVYMRWTIGGMDGGSYRGGKHFTREAEKKPQFRALDLVLKELKPDLTFLQFRDLEYLIKSTDKNDISDYYGNYDEYGIEYILLSELQSKIDSFENGSDEKEDCGIGKERW